MRLTLVVDVDYDPAATSERGVAELFNQIIADAIDARRTADHGDPTPRGFHVAGPMVVCVEDGEVQAAGFQLGAPLVPVVVIDFNADVTSEREPGDHSLRRWLPSTVDRDEVLAKVEVLPYRSLDSEITDAAFAAVMAAPR